jgi:hypothetical protein
MTNYVRARHSIEISQLSDYSRALEQAQEFTTTANETTVRRTVSFNSVRLTATGGEHVDLSSFSTINGLIVANPSTSAFSVYCEYRSLLGQLNGGTVNGTSFAIGPPGTATFNDIAAASVYTLGAHDGSSVTISNATDAGNNNTFRVQMINVAGSVITFAESDAITTRANDTGVGATGVILQFYDLATVIIPARSFISINGYVDPSYGLYFWTSAGIDTILEVSAYGS